MYDGALTAPSRLDATRLLPKLWIGGAPRGADDVLRAGFRFLVLCAVEIQPPDHALGRLKVLRCPLRDDGSRRMDDSEWMQAIATARHVALLVRDGQHALVTCAQGRNRSGLVCALALHFLYGWSGSDCVRYIQKRRLNSLQNADFVDRLVRRLG